MDTHTTSVSYLPLWSSASDSCLGRTCLKWTADGELSDTDAQLILQRLRQVDTQVKST